MINWTTTAQAALHGVKALVYGRAGVGKTTLCATLPTPLIISCEAGLLSLRHLEIPVATVRTLGELAEVYNWLAEDAGKTFKSVALDSISEIAETCLAAQLKITKDGRKAYGENNNAMLEWIRAFRDLAGINVLFTAKQELVDTGNGMRQGCSMPGKTLTIQLPYFFDEVFHFGIGTDGESTYRYLLTQPDTACDAKDRSGALDVTEYPDMTNIIKKICQT